MSTKTTFKRISLVAVAAMGIGMLTAVPSNAAGPVFSAGAYGTFGTSTITQVVGGQASTVVTLDASTITNIAVTGVGSIVSASAAGAASHAALVAGQTTWSDSTTSATGGTDTIVIGSSVAGVTTITATPLTSGGAPGTSVTQTITWGAAPVVGVQFTKIGYGSVPATVVTLANAGTFTQNTLSVSDAANSAAVAQIAVQPYDTSGNTMGATEKLSASISGPGTLGLSAAAGFAIAAASQGRSLTSTVAGAYGISVYGDGTPGTSTVTISDGAVVLGTVTVTFTGAAAKVTAVQNLYVLKAGSIGDATATAGHQYQGAQSAADQTTVLNTATGATGLPAITVKTTDSTGAAVTLSGFDSTKIKVVSSNSAVLTAGSCAQATSTNAATNEINCLVTGTVGAASGATATATVEVYDAATGAFDIVAAPLTFTIGGAVASMVLTTDAASYTPLAPMKLIATVKDSSGNAAYDQNGPAVGTITSSIQVGGTLGSAASIVNGTGKSSTFYAPSVSGDFSISGTDALSTAGEAVSVTATVAGGDTSAAVDAANAATDAANYAADAADAATTAAQEATAAAQAAQDSADAATAAVVALGLRVDTLMASVRAQLTSLSNLLVRIIKKTHA